MFAPLYGIPEESATGMAAGPLAAYLRDKRGIQKEKFSIEQGHLMIPPSPSLIHVELYVSEKNIRSLVAGGRATVTREITVNF
jgi:PhzF family phenazine biosynthesis protein